MTTSISALSFHLYLSVHVILLRPALTRTLRLTSSANSCPHFPQLFIRKTLVGSWVRGMPFSSLSQAAFTPTSQLNVKIHCLPCVSGGSTQWSLLISQTLRVLGSGSHSGIPPVLSAGSWSKASLHSMLLCTPLQLVGNIVPKFSVYD